MRNQPNTSLPCQAKPKPRAKTNQWGAVRATRKKSLRPRRHAEADRPIARNPSPSLSPTTPLRTREAPESAGTESAAEYVGALRVIGTPKTKVIPTAATMNVGKARGRRDPPEISRKKKSRSTWLRRRRRRFVIFARTSISALVVLAFFDFLILPIPSF